MQAQSRIKKLSNCLIEAKYLCTKITYKIENYKCIQMCVCARACMS